MSTPDITVAAQVDELLRRSSLRVEQQRIHVAELCGHQALLAEGALTEMLASIDQLTTYRAKLLDGENIYWNRDRRAWNPSPESEREEAAMEKAARLAHAFNATVR